MAKVTINIAASNPVNFGSWIQFAGYKFSLTGQPDQITNNLSADFLAVATGNYTATVQAVTAGGANLGAACTAPVAVTDPGQLINIPVNLSYNQAPG